MKKLTYLVAVLCLLVSGSASFGELVAHYEFNGNYNDSVGNNHGTVYGQTSIVNDGQRGQVASFDGDGDYIDCGNDSSLQSSDFSVALWFNSSSWTTIQNGYNGIISKRDEFNSSLDWEIYYDGNHDEIRSMTTSEFALFQNDNINPTLNTWHHLAFTKSGTQAELYIDGYLKSTDITNEIISTSGTLRIGTIGLDRINQAFDGYIDDVRIYDHALSSQEIMQLVPEPMSVVLLTTGMIFLRKKR